MLTRPAFRLAHTANQNCSRSTMLAACSPLSLAAPSAAAVLSVRALHASAPLLLAEKKSASSKKSAKSDSQKKSATAKKPAEEKKPKHVSLLAKDQLPTRVTSPWMLFNIKQWEELKANTPDGQKLPLAPEVTKEHSSRYKALSAQEKDALIREYEEKRDAYNAKYEDIVGAMSSLDIQKENAHRAQQRKSGKSRKGNLIDPTKPKAPKNSYMLFYLEQKPNAAELKDQHVTQASKLLADQWAGMSAQERSKYVEQAEVEKKKYYEAKEKWLAQRGSS